MQPPAHPQYMRHAPSRPSPMMAPMTGYNSGYMVYGSPGGPPAGMPYGQPNQQLTKPKKEIKRRTKTGCLTCRKRRIKISSLFCFALGIGLRLFCDLTGDSGTRRGRLLFSKSKVYVHPSSSAKDNIPGFIALVRPAGASDDGILLAWVPETVLATDEYSAYTKVDLIVEEAVGVTTRTRGPDGAHSYSTSPGHTQAHEEDVLVSLPPISSISSYAFSIPLHRIYSIMLRPPSLGWWWGSIIIHTRGEDAVPALFFHDAESQSTILQQRQRNKTFTPYSPDGDLFWGGEHFMKYLGRFARVERSTFEQRLYLVNPDPDDMLAFQPPSAHIEKAKQDNLGRILKDARWSLLEKFARVTNFSRKAAQDVIGNSPPAVRAMLNVPEVKQLGDDFDSARMYLAKWALSISEEAERNKTRIVWNDVATDNLGPVEILSVQHRVERRHEVSRDEWNAFFDQSGRLCVTVTEVKERVFHGGLAADARAEAWLFLLGVYPWDSSQIERQAIIASKRDEYFRLKRRWWDDVERQQTDSFWKDQRNRIEKDVHRTDRSMPLFRGEDIPHPDPNSPFASVGTNVHLEQLKDMLITYNEYNTSLGYVQGMSDLLSPIYAVIQDDAVAFWAFVHFMNRMQRNFLRDQSGMHRQLLALDNLVQLMEPRLYAHLERADSTNFFFVFRMLLVWFKREFVWNDVLRLWEVLWTDYLSSQFHLFVALAILVKHKDVIMDHFSQFDEVLKYVNELSKTIPLEETLTNAEILFYQFQRTVEAIDKKNKEPTSTSSWSSSSISSNGEHQKPLPLTPEAGKVIISDVLRELLSKEIIKVEDTVPLDGYE
ncbi:rab-GTPase-TBC domain-containing protein [Dipodascopsis tothii]|uniref:rab-GTPase-TBC domain-containing protein n=1 Tax=Dipodascopsis tothii TaxID=44089 RepID=UPI0034CF4D3B